MSWKDFFYFSQRERQGILLLIVLIIGIFFGKLIFSSSKSEPLENYGITRENPHQQSNNSIAFAESPYTPLFSKKSKQENKTYFKSQQKEEKRTYYNNVSSQETHTKREKFAKGTVIELNSTDTASLIKIPGIGTTFANRIIAYRQSLGGYHRIEQLQEVYGMYVELYEKIIPYLKIDANKITQIPINSVSIKELQAHPYINFHQAKTIIDIRRRTGILTNIEELKSLEEFSDEDWIRIIPYLNFD